MEAAEEGEDGEEELEGEILEDVKMEVEEPSSFVASKQKGLGKRVEEEIELML